MFVKEDKRLYYTGRYKGLTQKCKKFRGIFFDVIVDDGSEREHTAAMGEMHQEADGAGDTVMVTNDGRPVGW
jgi:hypothetical protein